MALVTGTEYGLPDAVSNGDTRPRAFSVLDRPFSVKVRVGAAEVPVSATVRLPCPETELPEAVFPEIVYTPSLTVILYWRPFTPLTKIAPIGLATVVELVKDHWSR